MENFNNGGSGEIFSVDLKENGGFFRFYSFQELQNWIQKEWEAWRWADLPDIGPHLLGIKRALESLNDALSASTGAEFSNGEQAVTDAQLDACRGKIIDAFLSRGLPYSETPVARRINEFRAKHGNALASYYLAAFISMIDMPEPLEPKNVETWYATLVGLNDKFGYAKADKQASLEAALDRLRAQMERNAQEQDLELRNAKEQRRNAQDEFAEKLKKMMVSHAELVDEHRAALKAIRESESQNNKLKAPATYWLDKQMRHERLVKLFGGLSFGGIFVALIILAFVIWYLLHELKSATPQTWQVAILAVISLFVVWAVRLTVRMFLSHQHLYADAEERVVMMKAYLSMVEDQGIGADERHLMLASLFRPSSDGLIKDEGLPMSWIEAITRPKS